jgi:hypothetical protein
MRIGWRSFGAGVLRKNAAAIMQVVLQDRHHGADGPNRDQLSKVIRYSRSLIPEAFEFRPGSFQCRGEYPAEFRF